MNTKITLVADFNNIDKDGRIRLNTVGTIQRIKENEIMLTEGLKILLKDYDELTTAAVVGFSTLENIWVAKITWSDFQ